MRDQVEPNRYRGPVELAAVADFPLGALWVQPSIRRISAGALEELIEPRVMQALVALAEAQGAVVSRDVLIDRCWDGRIVGDDAINRCIAKVRRLAETAEPPAFSIETVARVGYRLKALPPTTPAAAAAEPATGSTGPSAACTSPAIPPAPSQISAATAPPTARRSWPWRRGTTLAAAAIAACAVAWLWLAPQPPPPDRMTLRIDPFKATTQEAASLAAKFTEAAIERLSQSEVLVVSTAPPAAGAGAAPRYTLSGTVQAEGDTAKITVQVVEQPTGHLLYTNQTQQPAGIAQPAIYAATVRLTGGVEWRIRDAELARYRGKPRDALDMILLASQDTDDWAPVHDPDALALAEHTLALEPDNVAAQSLLATLLYLDFQVSDAQRGDAEGRRALALVDTLLQERPLNLIHQHLHAALLAALGDLHGAEQAARNALATEPDNPGMLATLSGALLQQGDIAGSIRVLPAGEDSQDDFVAAQQFAQARYPDALATMQRVAAQTPLQGPSLLFEAAILAHLGHFDEAHATLTKALACLPPALNHVTAIRQSLFKLPDPSWGIFKADLRKAGMAG